MKHLLAHYGPRVAIGLTLALYLGSPALERLTSVRLSDWMPPGELVASLVLVAVTWRYVRLTGEIVQFSSESEARDAVVQLRKVALRDASGPAHASALKRSGYLSGLELWDTLCTGKEVRVGEDLALARAEFKFYAPLLPVHLRPSAYAARERLDQVAAVISRMSVYIARERRLSIEEGRDATWEGVISLWNSPLTEGVPGEPIPLADVESGAVFDNAASAVSAFVAETVLYLAREPRPKIAKAPTARDGSPPPKL